MDGYATVTFRDLRFMYDTFLTRGGSNSRDNPPILGTVTIDPNRKIAEMGVERPRSKVAGSG